MTAALANENEGIRNYKSDKSKVAYLIVNISLLINADNREGWQDNLGEVTKTVRE